MLTKDQVHLILFIFSICIIDLFRLDTGAVPLVIYWWWVRLKERFSSGMDLLRMDIHRFLNEFIVIVSVNVVSITFRSCFFTLISSWSPPKSRDRIKIVILHMLIYMRRRYYLPKSWKIDVQFWVIIGNSCSVYCTCILFLRNMLIIPDRGYLLILGLWFKIPFPPFSS